MVEGNGKVNIESITQHCHLWFACTDYDPPKLPPKCAPEFPAIVLVAPGTLCGTDLFWPPPCGIGIGKGSGWKLSFEFE